MSDTTYVVPTRDRPELVLRAVRSITDLGHRVIVVDDGSIEPVVIDHPLVQVIRHPTPLGVAAARNTGVDAVTSEWVAFLDDDDETLPRPAPHGQLCVYGFDRAITSETIADSLTPSLCQTAVRRSVCLPFDDSYPACQDVEWWLRISQVQPVTQIPEPGFRWNRHDGVRLGNGPDARLAAWVRLLEHHRDFFDTHARARAFRHARIAAAHRRDGRWLQAVSAAARSLRAHPTLRPVTALVKGV